MEMRFIALMCCSKADRECPVVDGAQSRYAIHYVDPKDCDDTDEEATAYDERCREIGLEMFYLMSQIKN
jgi:arsenate reductase